MIETTDTTIVRAKARAFFGEEVRIVGEPTKSLRAKSVPPPGRQPLLRNVGVLWVLFDAPECFEVSDLALGVYGRLMRKATRHRLLASVRWELARRGVGSIVRVAGTRKLTFVPREVQ